MIPFSRLLTISLITFVNVDSVYSKGPVALRTPSESVPARIPSDATYCHVMKEMMQTLHETFAGNASESLGGGAINEKRKFYCGENKELEQQQQQTASTSAENISSSFGRLYNPEQVLSHSLHATMGLDRYPNYLHRWSEYEQDIDALEHSLKQQLFVVHKQREEMLRRREGIQQLVKAVGKQLLESAIPEAATKLERNEDRGVDMPFPLRPPQSWGEVKEKVLHPSAAKVVFKSEFFSGNVLDNVTIEDFMNGKEEVKLDLALLENWIEQEMFDVYSFPLLSEGVRKFAQD